MDLGSREPRRCVHGPEIPCGRPMAERDPAPARGAEPAVPDHQPAAAIREPGGQLRAPQSARHQGDPGRRRSHAGPRRDYSGRCGRSNTAPTPPMSTPTRSITRWPAASAIRLVTQYADDGGFDQETSSSAFSTRYRCSGRRVPSSRIDRTLNTASSRK